MGRRDKKKAQLIESGKWDEERNKDQSFQRPKVKRIAPMTIHAAPVPDRIPNE